MGAMRSSRSADRGPGCAITRRPANRSERQDGATDCAFDFPILQTAAVVPRSRARACLESLRDRESVISAAEQPGIFATTQWSVVLAARGSPSPAAQVALDRLCSVYWYAIYAYVRSKQFSPHEAEDLTQEYFGRLLASDALRIVSERRGRFRAFLLASLNHFLANEWDRLRAQKRGGGRTLLSLDAVSAEDRLRFEPVTDLSPDRLYDRRWALALLDRVLERLRAEMAAAGKAMQFDALRGFLSDVRGTLSYGEAAARAELSEATTRQAVHRLRVRYRDLLREEVAQTVAAPHEAEDELRQLLAAFA